MRQAADHKRRAQLFEIIAQQQQQAADGVVLCAHGAHVFYAGQVFFDEAEFIGAGLAFSRPASRRRALDHPQNGDRDGGIEQHPTP